MRVIITAGFDRAPQAVALFQLLLRDGHEIAAVLVVNPFNLKRALALLRSGGSAALRGAVRKLFGRSGAAPSGSASPIRAFFEAQRLRSVGLKRLASEHRVPYRLVDDLNGDEALSQVARARADGAVYCGGGILRRAFLDAVRGRILNAHAGPLPQVRGMNAAEWALLLGLPLDLTVHFIDEGVDTGPTVGRVDIPVETGDSIEVVRERSIVAGINGLRAHVEALRQPLPVRSPDAAEFRQYFVLSDLLRAILEARLARAGAETA